MNYLPFCGYWFYGGSNADERASYFSSWGLLDDSPAYVVVPGVLKIIGSGLKKLIG